MNSHNEPLYEILDVVSASIYWKDKNGRYLGCNKYMLDMVGLKDRSEVIGKRDSDLIWGGIAEELGSNDQHVIQNKVTCTFEESAVLANKKNKRTFITTKTPFYGKNGEVLGVIGVSTDVTDHKKTEEPRIQHEASQKAVKFANMVADLVAHELRTPLAVISMQMDLLDLAMANNKTSQKEKLAFCKEVIGTVKRVIKGAAHVIDNLLIKLKSLAAGKDFIPQNNFKRLSITDDVEDVLAIYPFQENEKELINFCRDNGFEYRGDRDLSRHALSNLIKNALRAIKETEKEQKSEIIIKLEKGKDFNQLIFRDTATGMPPELLSRVFEQFTSKTTSDNGSGLGLSFCKIVMQSYGGDISCNSEQGKYTEFVLSFPKIK